MRRLFIASHVLILYLSVTASGKPPGYPCLPPGVKATEVVTAKMVGSGPRGPVIKKVTVGQELRRLRARCLRGRLVDGTGKEIRFYRLTIAGDCFGVQPPDYEQRLAAQEREVTALKRRYRVIEMTCNPEGIPRP
ncbi:MAG TPA: hypothetical protein VF591_08710 [Pyrinomonadaceae bacterium]